MQIRSPTSECSTLRGTPLCSRAIQVSNYFLLRAQAGTTQLHVHPSFVCTNMSTLDCCHVVPCPKFIFRETGEWFQNLHWLILVTRALNGLGGHLVRLQPLLGLIHVKV